MAIATLSIAWAGIWFKSWKLILVYVTSESALWIAMAIGFRHRILRVLHGDLSALLPGSVSAGPAIASQATTSPNGGSK